VRCRGSAAELRPDGSAVELNCVMQQQRTLTLSSVGNLRSTESPASGAEAASIAADRGQGLSPTVTRAWRTVRSESAGTIAIAFALSLWAAVTGLIVDWMVAVIAGLSTFLILGFEAGDERKVGLSPSEVSADLANKGLVWVLSLSSGLVAGIAAHSALAIFDDFVRLWLSSAAGMLLWSTVAAAFWPSFARPTLAEYETTWLARATTIGVAIGAFRALAESVLLHAEEGEPTEGPISSVFANATDTVARATFGIALFGGVLFLALAAGAGIDRFLGGLVRKSVGGAA